MTPVFKFHVSPKFPQAMPKISTPFISMLPRQVLSYQATGDNAVRNFPSFPFLIATILVRARTDSDLLKSMSMKTDGGGTWDSEISESVARILPALGYSGAPNLPSEEAQPPAFLPPPNRMNNMFSRPMLLSEHWYQGTKKYFFGGKFVSAGPGRFGTPV